MADYRAIWATCEAVIKLLESNYKPEYIDNTNLDFRIFLSKDFSQGMASGVSLFLYRIFFNNSHRTPSGWYRSDDQRYYTQLPLDLHFLLTAWGKTASLQHTISGWMMRTLEDTPIIPNSFLHDVAPGIFRDNETVEISLAEMTTEDMLRLWEVTAQNEYQVSVPYIARNVRIESTHLRAEGQPTQERTFDFMP